MMAAAQQNDAPTPLENHLVDIVSLIESNDYGEAGRILDSLSSIYPEDDALQYYSGVCAYSQGRSAQAAERFAAAVQADTSNTWYREALAAAYISLGDSQSAGEVYLDLAKVNPRKFRNAYTLTLIADAYRAKRDYPRMFESLTQFAQDQSIGVDVRFQYLMNAVGRIDPRDFMTQMPRIDSLSKAFISAEPRSVEPHDMRLQIHSLLRQWEGVISEADKIRSLTRDPALVVQMTGLMGDACHELGDKRRTFGYYEYALRLDPEYCPVLNNYAWHLCTERRKLKKAEQMSRITIEKEPDNATYLDTYAWILYLRGRAKEAKPYFKHAMLYGGKDSETILRHYAAVLDALGEEDLAKYYRGLADAKKSESR